MLVSANVGKARVRKADKKRSVGQRDLLTWVTRTSGGVRALTADDVLTLHLRCAISLARTPCLSSSVGIAAAECIQ